MTIMSLFLKSPKAIFPSIFLHQARALEIVRTEAFSECILSWEILRGAACSRPFCQRYFFFVKSLVLFSLLKLCITLQASVSSWCLSYVGQPRQFDPENGPSHRGVEHSLAHCKFWRDFLSFSIFFFRIFYFSKVFQIFLLSSVTLVRARYPKENNHKVAFFPRM